MKERRNDIDWLRVLAVVGVFLVHCNRFFDSVGWHLKNDEQSAVATMFSGWIWLWVMPLFFLLSGAGSWYALRSRTPGQYLLERVKRILIPLYTVGMVILLPPQLYFELVTNRGYTGNFWELIPRYVSHMISSGVSFRSPFFSASGSVICGFSNFFFLSRCWPCLCLSILNQNQVSA